MGPAPNPAAYTFEQDIEKRNGQGFQDFCDPQKVPRLSKSERKKRKFEESVCRKEAHQIVQQQRAEEKQQKLRWRRERTQAAKLQVEKPLAMPETFAWFHNPHGEFPCSS